MILGLQVAVRNRWLEQWLRVRREGFGNKHGFKRSDIHTHSLHNFSSPPRGKWGSHALSLTSTQITEAAISSVDSPPSFPCSIAFDGQWIKTAPLQAWKNIIMWSGHIQAAGGSPVYLEGHLAIRIESLKGWYPITPIIPNLLRSLRLPGFQTQTSQIVCSQTLFNNA